MHPWQNRLPPSPPSPPSRDTDLTDIFGPVIYAYTRAQAIEDGNLVDVSSVAREAGIKFPVALTRAVWCECVEVPPGVRGQDEAGRLWDVLWMLRCNIRTPSPRTGGEGRGEGVRQPDRILYQLLVRKNGGLRRVTLKALCGPGDDAEPVITIMQPDES